MRVHEAAKKLDIDSKIILDYLKDKGREVKSHMSAITDEDYAAIKAMTEKKGAHAAPLSAGHPAQGKKPAAAAHQAGPAAAGPADRPDEAKQEKTAHGGHPPKPAQEAKHAAPAPKAPPAQEEIKPAPQPAAPAVQVKEEPRTPAPAVPPVAAAPAPKPVEKEIVEINRGITVGELAKKLEVKATELIKKLIGLGVIATINQTLSEEEVHVVVSEFGREAKFKEVKQYSELNQ